MSLHHHARGYLFKSFIERNYQGLNEISKSELLSLHPDEIIHLKKKLKKYSFFLEYLQRVHTVSHSERYSERVRALLSHLWKFLKADFVFFLCYQGSEANGYYKKTTVHGTQSKLLKSWQPDIVQNDFLFGQKNTGSKVVFTKNQHEDFFQNLDVEFEFFPMNFIKNHFGYLAVSAPAPSPQKNKLRYAFLQLILTTLVYNFISTSEIEEKNKIKKQIDNQTKLNRDLLKELSDSVGFNPSSLPIITKRLGLDPWILFKKEGNKLRSFFSGGFKNYKPTSIPIRKDISQDGFCNSQTRLYVQEYMDHLDFSPKTIFIKSIEIEKNNFIFLF